jgi:hypothetical protein
VENDGKAAYVLIRKGLEVGCMPAVLLFCGFVDVTAAKGSATCAHTALQQDGWRVRAPRVLVISHLTVGDTPRGVRDMGVHAFWATHGGVIAVCVFGLACWWMLQGT